MGSFINTHLKKENDIKNGDVLKWNDGRGWAEDAILVVVEENKSFYMIRVAGYSDLVIYSDNTLSNYLDEYGYIEYLGNIFIDKEMLKMLNKNLIKCKINKDRVKNSETNEYIIDKEKKILNLLVDTWNCFLELSVQHDSERNQFAEAIHKCQHLIAIRIARAACPNIFYNKENEEVKES